MSTSADEPARFSTFDVSKQVFLDRAHTLGIVNLKPIVPLHVLVITRKPYERLEQVPRVELHQLFDAVQHVSSVVQRLTNATACTVSIQDGKEAGQSVPHLHIHILPRKSGDFTPNDAIYDRLDAFGNALQRDMQAQKRGLTVDAAEERKPRTAEEMEKEAAWLRQHVNEGEDG